MFKLVVLFSVLALTAAKPGWVSPVTYSSVVPAVSSVSQYRSDVYHGSPVVPSVYSAYSPVAYSYSGFPAVTTFPQGVHSIAKRSVVSPLTYTSVVSPVSAPYTHVASVAPVTPFVRNTYTPVAYSSPFYSAYTVPGYGYSAVAPKAYSVHSW